MRTWKETFKYARSHAPMRRKVSVTERVYMTFIGLAKIVDGLVMAGSLSFLQSNLSGQLSSRFANLRRKSGMCK